MPCSRASFEAGEKGGYVSGFGGFGEAVELEVGFNALAHLDRLLCQALSV